MQNSTEPHEQVYLESIEGTSTRTTEKETVCEEEISRFVSQGTQTEEFSWPITSSPIKNTDDAINLLSLCESQIQSDDDSEYLPDCSNCENIEEKSTTDIIKEKKFVVYEGMLDQLFKLVACRQCHLPAENIIKSHLGTSIHCKLYCQNDHLITDWKSQPLLGKLPSFNLLICAAIFFSGSTYETFKKPVTFAGLNFVNPTTFYNIQRTLVIPCINIKFDHCIKSAREETKATASEHVILGDGRFDSPGKSAKYCSYTCQSQTTKKIIASSTIQTSKGKGSAPLELKGFVNCLEELESDGFELAAVATDRNRQLAKWMRVNRSNIEHCFDPWHFSKNIKAKLRKVVRRKDCKIIQEWIKPIGNHLFWCADNCNGDAETLRQMWQSILYHITNKHTFKKKYPKYPKCSHPPYSREKSRKKKWIKKNSPAYTAIEKVVMDKKNLKDMGQIIRPLHTGSLEVFHSVINSYASKRQEFELNLMNARVKLAIIDHNSNINRVQAVISKERKGSGKKGEKQWKIVSSRLSKEWVAKERKEPKSLEFVSDLLANVVECKKKGEKIDKKVSEIAGRFQGPLNIAYTERPEKLDILEKHNKIKRFKK